MRPLLTLSLLLASAASAQDWSAWHGANFDGVAPDGDYPTEWSAETNVAWSVDLSGRGSSTPAVHSGRVFLTDDLDGQNGLLCLNLSDGSERWRKTVGRLVPPKHKKASGTNPSPVTDGERVFAYFKSGDLAAFTADGEPLWQTNIQKAYGENTLWWDLGTSPVLTDEAVVVTVMQTGPSFLVAFDKQTGELKWKADRDLGAPEEAAQSYTTPAVVTHDGVQQLVVVGADHVTSHDAATGKELWRVGGLNPSGDKFFRSISSPAVGDGVVVAPYSRGETVTAVQLGGSGDLSGTDEVLWSKTGIGSDVPTPVVADGRVYVLGDKGKNGGVIWCLDLVSGEELWTLRLPKARHAYSSSPMLAGGKLYLTREDGTTFVVDPEAEKVVATNELGDAIFATPAFADGRVLLRTVSKLVCVE